MSGFGQIWVQPGLFQVVQPAAGQWYRAGPGTGNPIAPNGSVSSGLQQNFGNLFADSPPTILEEYEVVSYAIGFGIQELNGAAWASAPVYQVELALLLNDRVRQVNSQSVTSQMASNGETAVAAGAWVADLVNPIQVGARDRLGIRIGFQPNVATSSIIPVQFVVGQQWETPGAPVIVGYESTISYNVNDLPARRRL